METGRRSTVTHIFSTRTSTAVEITISPSLRVQSSPGICGQCSMHRPPEPCSWSAYNNNNNNDDDNDNGCRLHLLIEENVGQVEETKATLETLKLGQVKVTALA